MESTSSNLILTAEYFKLMLQKIHNKFLEKHNLSKLPKAFQLYGYADFNEKYPNLKQDFEIIGSEFINGKYLYDKSRELEKGKPQIKLNNHYKNIILIYLGYNNINDFIEDYKLSETEYNNQLALISKTNDTATYYYLNYYFGEDDTILKGQTIISNNWKKIQHIFMYPLEDGTIREHYSSGHIKIHDDKLTIKTNTLSGNRYIDSASEIYYIGHKTPSNLKYLIGTYCTFDIFSNTVAGRSILEKCASKSEMETKSKSPFIPPYIAMEIRNKRIVNNKVTPRNELELSHQSPYAFLYSKLPGNYELNFDFGNNFKETLKFKIRETNFQIVTGSENVYIEKDRIELLNKGSVIHFRFNLSGIIAFERVNIFIKSYYLKSSTKIQKGVFSGIDNENRLINGTLTVNYSNS